MWRIERKSCKAFVNSSHICATPAETGFSSDPLDAGNKPSLAIWTCQRRREWRVGTKDMAHHTRFDASPPLPLEVREAGWIGAKLKQTALQGFRRTGFEK